MGDVAVVIPAGGKGRRLGGVLPKQYLRIGGRTILELTVEKFDRLGAIGQIVVVVPKGYVGRTHRILSRAGLTKVTAIIEGGKERQDSVARGVAMLSGDPGIVLVHDAVRPFVTPAVIRSVIHAARRHGAAVVGVPVKDTIKVEGRRGFYHHTLPRHTLWAVQTPQGFRTSLLVRAHRAAARAGVYGTDEASLLERLGIPVKIVVGDERNVKITTRKDLLAGRLLLEGSERRSGLQLV